VHLQLFLDLGAALRPRLVESAEPDSRQIAQDPYVMKTETARADDADARIVAQITTPRSLASTKRISSFTSGSGSSSACTRSIAWVTFISERKSSR